jgi:nicotinamide riboside kinase
VFLSGPITELTYDPTRSFSRPNKLGKTSVIRDQCVTIQTALNPASETSGIEQLGKILDLVVKADASGKQTISDKKKQQVAVQYAVRDDTPGKEVAFTSVDLVSATATCHMEEAPAQARLEVILPIQGFDPRLCSVNTVEWGIRGGRLLLRDIQVTFHSPLYVVSQLSKSHNTMFCIQDGWQDFKERTSQTSADLKAFMDKADVSDTATHPQQFEASPAGGKPESTAAVEENVATQAAAELAVEENEEAEEDEEEQPVTTAAEEATKSLINLVRDDARVKQLLNKLLTSIDKNFTINPGGALTEDGTKDPYSVLFRYPYDVAIIMLAMWQGWVERGIFMAANNRMVRERGVQDMFSALYDLDQSSVPIFLPDKKEEEDELRKDGDFNEGEEGEEGEEDEGPESPAAGRNKSKPGSAMKRKRPKGMQEPPASRTSKAAAKRITKLLPGTDACEFCMLFAVRMHCSGHDCGCR